jgi:serine/threonine protein kinase
MPLAIGQTLQQRYQIHSLLGQGGMGVVYRAYDPVLQRTVAIKVLPPQLTIDAEFVTRFQREAIASANLRHAHIVTVYDVGQQDGEYFIIMEYLEGDTLEQWLAQHGPMPVAQASQVLDQIAGALDHAHGRGIVHRDIKPSNIMLDVQGRAVLMDFGLVRAGEGLGPTRSTTVMGTPEYMAPEQILGQAIDRRTDIYALGVVLYELLAGKTPFRHTTPIATAYAHVHEAPPPVRSVNKAVSQSIEAVVLKALAKDPTARYQSAGSLARDFALATSGAMPAGLAAQSAAAPSSKQQTVSPAGGVGRNAIPPSADAGTATTVRWRQSRAGAFVATGALALVALLLAAILWPRAETGSSLSEPSAPSAVVVAAAATHTAALPIASPTDTATATPSATRPASATPTATPSVLPTRSPTATSIKTTTPTTTASPTRTATRTATPTTTATRPPVSTNTAIAVSPTVPAAPPAAPAPLVSLGAPQLLDPPDEESLTGVARLQYSGVNGAAGYVVETRSDRAGQQEWRRWPVSGSETTINLAFDALGEYFSIPGTVYYWKVAAVDASGNIGPYSDQRRFVFQRPSNGSATTGAVLPVSPSTGDLVALSSLLSIGFMLALVVVSSGIDSPKDR